MARSYLGVFTLLLVSGCLPGDEQTQHDSGQEDARAVPPCMEITIRVDKRVLRCMDTEGGADVADPNETNDARATSNVAPVLRYSLLERVEAVEHVHRIIAREFGEDGSCVVDSHTSAIAMIPNLRHPVAAFHRRWFGACVTGDWNNIATTSSPRKPYITARMMALNCGELTFRLLRRVTPITGVL